MPRVGVISPSARVRRAASRSPRRAPPPRAPFGAPAGRGGASPSPWGGGALYPVGVLAGCAPLLLPVLAGFALLTSVCPRRGGRAVGLRALRAPRAFFISSRRPPLRCAAVVGAALRPAPVVRVLPPVGARQIAPFPAPCPFSLSGMFLRRVPPAACEALRAVFSAARSAPFRASPRVLPRFARRVVFMPPRHARKRAGACVDVKVC